MMLTAGVEVNGVTFREFAAASESDVAAGITKDTLEKAGQQDSSWLDAWVKANGWDGLGQELASHAVGFMQGSMAGILAQVWEKCEEVRTSAAETKGKLNATELVSLLDHDFTYSLKPEVDIEVNKAVVARIPFSIELTCTVKGLQLQIRDGGIGGVRTGACAGSTSIKMWGVEIWSRQLLHRDLPGDLRWNSVLRLA
jgi:hypothetical protein